MGGSFKRCKKNRLSVSATKSIYPMAPTEEKWRQGEVGYLVRPGVNYNAVEVIG